MPTQSMVVRSVSGLHARPAAAIAKLARGCAAPVYLSRCGGEAVSADSAVLVMLLGAERGCELTIESEDAAAVRAIAALIATHA